MNSSSAWHRNRRGHAPKNACAASRAGGLLGQLAVVTGAGMQSSPGRKVTRVWWIGNPTTLAQTSSRSHPQNPHAACAAATIGLHLVLLLRLPSQLGRPRARPARPAPRRAFASPVCAFTIRCADRAGHRVLPGLPRPGPVLSGSPARHHLQPVRHTRSNVAACRPGRWAAPRRPSPMCSRSLDLHPLGAERKDAHVAATPAENERRSLAER